MRAPKPRPVSSGAKQPNPFISRTSEKRTPNPFRIRTSKTKDLKSFRIRTYEKNGEGGGYRPFSPNVSC